MDFSSRELVSFGIIGTLQALMMTFFILGTVAIVWHHLGGVSGVIDTLADVLGRVIGPEQGREAADAIDEAADRMSGWVADKTIRTSLPPDGPLREAYLRGLYAETIGSNKKALELLEEIRKMYVPQYAGGKNA